MLRPVDRARDGLAGDRDRERAGGAATIHRLGEADRQDGRAADAGVLVARSEPDDAGALVVVRTASRIVSSGTPSVSRTPDTMSRYVDIRDAAAGAARR